MKPSLKIKYANLFFIHENELRTQFYSLKILINNWDYYFLLILTKNLI